MAELPILGRCSDAPRSTEASTMSSAESRSGRSLPHFTWRRLYSWRKLDLCDRWHPAIQNQPISIQPDP